jgi:hypothetical protein
VFLTCFPQENVLVLASVRGCGGNSLDTTRTASSGTFRTFCVSFSRLFQMIVRDERDVPMFDDPTKRAQIQDIASYEQTLAATRMMVRALRRELRPSKSYKWSKLELIDNLNVKQSDLSEWPLCIHCWHDPAAVFGKKSKPKRQKQGKKVEGKKQIDEGERKHESRVRQKPKQDKNFVYG